MSLAGCSLATLLAPLIAGAADRPAGAGFVLKHIVTGADGLSHAEDLNLSVAGASDALFSQAAKHVTLRTFAPGKVWDWHNSGGKRLIIVLQGAAETELSDGTRITTGPGSIFLAEDRTGKGHRGRVLSTVPVFNLDIELVDA